MDRMNRFSCGLGFESRFSGATLAERTPAYRNGLNSSFGVQIVINGAWQAKRIARLNFVDLSICGILCKPSNVTSVDGPQIAKA